MRLALRPTFIAAPPAGGWARTVVLRLMNRRKDLAYYREVARLKEAQPSVRDRQQELVRFYMHYEDLVETLVDVGRRAATGGDDGFGEGEAVGGFVGAELEEDLVADDPVCGAAVGGDEGAG